MLAFTHVLCPVDFSNPSIHALRHAAALARWYGAVLTIGHVAPGQEAALPAPALGDVPLAVRPTPDPSALAQQVTALATTVVGVDVATHVRVGFGRPHEVIRQWASADGVDLVVIGTHGRSGFDRLLLGSVTEKVIRTVTCPVLTVPPAEGLQAAVAFARILCPTDFSPSSRRALAVALELGRQAGGAVTLLHAVEFLDVEAALPRHADELRASRARLVDHFLHRLAEEVADESQTWCEIRQVLVEGRAHRAIVAEATAHQADLIVMGTHGHGVVDRFLYGSTALQVVRTAPCPVLTVRA